MLISVIIATHNGEQTLSRTLGALSCLERPAQGVEMLLVDNASSDRTPALLKAHEEVLPLRHLTEPRQGKSYALNHGIEMARGALLVFADDDVLPAPGWLTAYTTAAEAHPEVGLFAGQVRHEWDVPPPRWLEQLAAAGLSYAGTPETRQEGEIEAREIKGVNFMVRHMAMGNIRFPETPGKNFTGTYTSGGGEDTTFARRIMDSGVQSWYVPAAEVRHIVRAYQVGLRPVFQRYRRIGAATVSTNAPGRPADRRVFGYPLVDLRTAARYGLKICYNVARCDRERAARCMLSLAMAIGRIREQRRTNR